MSTVSAFLRALTLPAALVLASCVEPNWTVDRTISTAAVTTGISPGGYIPPGTIISLRTEEDVRGGPDSRGKTFRALLVREIIGGNGSVLAPAGTPAQLVIMNFYEGGKTTAGQVQLGLKSITPGGTPHPVHGGQVPYGPLGELVDASGSASKLKVKGLELDVPAHTVMDYQTDEPIYIAEPRAEQTGAALRSCLRKATECSARNVAPNFAPGIASVRNAAAISVPPRGAHRRPA